MRFRSQLSLISVDRTLQKSSPDNCSTFAPLSDLSKWENVEFFRCKVVYGSGIKFGVKPFDPPSRLTGVHCSASAGPRW